MIAYPRSRKETSDPPSAEEVSEALQEHWGYKALDIRQAQSRRVHYVDLPHRQVMFRANPGWDGPIPPPTIVQYVDHLSRQSAPAPGIIPTQRGELYARLRDHTLSVESRLPGEDMGENPLRFLRTVGQRLAQLHIAAETFSAHPCRMRPAGAYVQAMFERSLSRPLERDELQAVDDLRQNVEAGFSRVLGLEIPWIMCRGDVSRRNTLATGEGEIGFTDFDSAEYAPALFDLVMTRFQWFMGQGLLGLPEATEILLGYQSERPLRDSERSVFPEVWAAYYVDRLTFLRVKWGQTKRQRDVGGETLRLPECAVRTGQELLQAAGLFCGGHS